MKYIIKKILKESDFDWISDIPSFIEITEPVTQTNPKNVFRLHWTNGHGEDYGTWADNWYGFQNNSDGIDKLTRYIKILQNGIVRDKINFSHLADLYLKGGHDYIVSDWMKDELSKIPEDGIDDDTIYYDKEEALADMLSDDLNDMGLTPYDSYYGGIGTIEKWWVTYFDEYGVEFKTKINKI